VFAANSFKFGFGEQQMWYTIADLLEPAGTIVERRIKMKLDYGQIDEFIIERVDTKMNLFYLKSNLEIKSLDIDQGQFVFKIMASPVTGIRGICRLEATPVYMPVKLSTDKELKENISIDSLGFAVNMGPGDFFILGPQPEYAKLVRDETTDMNTAGEKSLTNFLFTNPEKNKVRLFAVFCTGISD
jgi:hypothetical protein